MNKSDYINKINQMAESMKVIREEVINSYEEGYIGKKTLKATLGDGTEVVYDQIRKNKQNGDAVVIIPITTEDKFVMVVESRPNTLTGVCVEFPAGMVDPGENPLVSAKRELLEETGYDCESIYELEAHYQDQGCSRAIIRTYVALGCKKIEEQHLGDDEKLEFIEMDYDTILDLVLNSKVDEVGISDSGTKIGFMTYMLKKGDKHE